MHRYENKIFDTRSHDLMDFSIFFYRIIPCGEEE